jgi:exopolyphosphatase/guanosine-5'-triphosphate,3'-diphosphate pyrophosphatase
MRVAGIDCGTNSIRLLIGDGEAGVLRQVTRVMRIVRLGQGVDETGRLAPEAIERTLAAVRDYADQCRDLGVEAVRMVATSAVRDADNAEDFTGAVREILGVEPEVVDGMEEAALSFAGALSTTGGEAPFLVCDLGGGSTELVLGETTPSQAYSMDVGCVRITERYLQSDPPTPAEIAAAASDIDRHLDAAAAAINLRRPRTIIGVAGTVTSLAAYTLGLSAYDPDRIDGAVIPIDDMLAACRRIWEMSRAQRLALGFLQPGRADVLGGGALIWALTLLRLRAAAAAADHELVSLTVSEHDILDGIALTAMH